MKPGLRGAALRPFLVSLLPAAGAALSLGLLAGVAVNAAAGAVLAALVMALAFARHAWHLAQLGRWLTDPQAATLPDAGGAWGEALADIYRLLKQERLAREALEDSLTRFRQAAAALPDGAMMLDRAHNIAWLNPVAERHWGISLSQDRQQAVINFIRFPEFLAYLAAQNFDEPLMLRHAGRVLSVQLVPFGTDQMLLLSRDVSERDRLETMRRDFVANVSHELRTPVTVMAGFVEMLEEAGTADPAVTARALGHMRQQTDRMRRLVEDLLTLSRLEDEGSRSPHAPVDVPGLIRALVADARELSAGRHRIEVDLADAWLVGSRDELESAFGNLIGNAVRYTPAGGTISVGWAVTPEGPVFRVQDDGEGIAAAHLPRLTERFYRVDRGRSRESGGTGLGLAIVKHVLLRHDATLAIESSQEAASHGSTFSARFPAGRASPAQPRPRAVAAA